MEARNSGAAVLLISEDLDEILELTDRIAVMFEGRFVYETLREEADVHEIGRHMASHGQVEAVVTRILGPRRPVQPASPLSCGEVQIQHDRIVCSVRRLGDA